MSTCDPIARTYHKLHTFTLPITGMYSSLIQCPSPNSFEAEAAVIAVEEEEADIDSDTYGAQKVGGEECVEIGPFT